MSPTLDSFGTKSTLKTKGQSLEYFSLKKLEEKTGKSLSHLPYSLRILLENMLRFEDGVTVKKSDIEAILNWDPNATPDNEIQFRPARIVLQDFTGVPAVADLAAMRVAMKALGGDPSKVNPLQPADLVIDHSVQVDHFGTSDALEKNSKIEFDRNKERYQFLRWGQDAFENFRVVPPDMGIVHQVNLEYLSHVAMTNKKTNQIYPDTLVGTDSHTTMINGLGVLGWGVGGIEAEAAMLGQPITMLIPQVVGFKLKGKLPAGTTATDLVLVVTHLLRKKGVVGKFVEFFGPGLESLTLADRATLSNMAPEYGATVGIFPVDQENTNYLRLTGRGELAETVKDYYQAQDLWFTKDTKDPVYSDTLELDMNTVVPSLAGPSRPQDHVTLTETAKRFNDTLASLYKKSDNKTFSKDTKVKVSGTDYDLEHGSIVIAAITSCTNTSNPVGLITAGLIAKKAVELGLDTKPWVKTSLAPGSRVVTDYYTKAGLMPYLEKLRFNVVGYGCTTCIGNSGPLPEPVLGAINQENLVVASVLSGNRNFEGRISPHVRANFLASPSLVVAYALAGNIKTNLTTEPLGKSKDGKDVFLKDIWPTSQEVQELVAKSVTDKMFSDSYKKIFDGDASWRAITSSDSALYDWQEDSTYIKEPPFFQNMSKVPEKTTDIKNARVLCLLGDSVTTDHISPAGSISPTSPAGQYLQSLNVSPKDFNSFGSRRGNHEVMIRGTFGNVRLKNQLAPGTEGPYTKYLENGKEDGEVTSIYDASEKYQANKVPLIVLAGKEYGTGSSRDWAAKGTQLLGVRAVIAESFERIHRSNLIGMGVLPLQFIGDDTIQTLGLKGTEVFEISGVTSVKPREKLKVTAKSLSGETKQFEVLVRIDTPNEVQYYQHGGILPYVLRQAL